MLLKNVQGYHFFGTQSMHISMYYNPQVGSQICRIGLLVVLAGWRYKGPETRFWFLFRLFICVFAIFFNRCLLVLHFCVVKCICLHEFGLFFPVFMKFLAGLWKYLYNMLSTTLCWVLCPFVSKIVLGIAIQLKPIDDNWVELSRCLIDLAPIATTFADFWCMVWEQNSNRIAMVTNLKEGGKVK